MERVCHPASPILCIGWLPFDQVESFRGGPHLELDGIKRTFVQLARVVNSIQQLGVIEDRAKLPS